MVFARALADVLHGGESAPALTTYAKYPVDNVDSFMVWSDPIALVLRRTNPSMNEGQVPMRYRNSPFSHVHVVRGRPGA